MGALQLTPTRAGTIRRVIRRGSQFICGLCRTHHAEENHAQACLTDCWAGLLALDPVIVKRRLVGVAYRCRFCARDYAKHGDAAVCAEDCKTHQLRLHEAEQSLTEAAFAEEPKRSAKTKPKLKTVKNPPAKAPRKIQPKPAKVQGKAEAALPNPISADVVTAPSAPFDKAQASVAVGGGAASGGEAAGTGTGGPKETEMLHGVGTGSYTKKKEEETVHGVGTGSYSKKDAGGDQGKSIDSGPRKLKTSDAFHRDGARYVCNGCQAKYFTRGEVETCFAGHK